MSRIADKQIPLATGSSAGRTHRRHRPGTSPETAALSRDSHAQQPGKYHVQRNPLERPCRYITRPAIANERLKYNRAGDVVLQLKSPYQDGTTHIVLSPLEFMQRLAALVPRPRLNLIRNHYLLSPVQSATDCPTRPAFRQTATMPQCFQIMAKLRISNILKSDFFIHPHQN
ncbi:MAG: transposase [Methylococcaceae bacterium]|nr:transposase [Methylococcaceae bacterium]